jgi:hypothetical protein
MMERRYRIPREGGGHLCIGKWVEIFEAYGQADGEEAIQVKSMRVGGKTFVFAKGGARPGTLPLRPHEGEIVLIDRGTGDTQFSIRLRS